MGQRARRCVCARSADPIGRRHLVPNGVADARENVRLLDGRRDAAVGPPRWGANSYITGIPVLGSLSISRLTAGGIIGTLVLLALAAGVYIWGRWRRRGI